MPTPLTFHGYQATDIHAKIGLLINNLVNIKDHAGQFLSNLPDGRVIDTKGWDDWEWTHGIGLYGLYQYYSLAGSVEALDIIKRWFRARLAEGTTKNINTMAVFLTLAYLYEETRDQTYLPWLDSWAEWAMYDLPRTPYGGFQHITYLEDNTNQLWDDTLMMTVMPLAKIGKLLNRLHYIDEAKRQFLLHVQYLQDPVTGLFFHGWEFEDPKDGDNGTYKVGHNFARARWARGNSWLTIAIPDFIELLDLSPTDPLCQFLVGVLDSQCRALAHLQDPHTGLWRTLLDVPETSPPDLKGANYLESSASAGFAYGLLKAIRKHYIPATPQYRDMTLRTVRGVVGRIDTETGELVGTSFGTAMGRDLQFYLDIPQTSMPYGQAMAIMALVEFLRMFV